MYKGTQFRTFDGKFFDYLGSCAYRLVDDCDEKKFSIRLKNDVVKFNAITKKISLKLFNNKVDIYSSKKIKANGTFINLPYEVNNTYNIEERNRFILLKMNIGIKIEWNYMSILKIKVSKDFRNKLCGLCGNFNSIQKDDMITSQNVLVNDPTIFAHSWVFTDYKNECLRNNIISRV